MCLYYSVLCNECVCVVAATDWFHGHFKLSCGSPAMDALIGEAAIRGCGRCVEGRGGVEADNGTGFDL